MLFPTAEFAVFLALALALSWALRGAGWVWRAALLALSWVFYGWWDWRYVGLLALSTVVNHALVGWMDGQIAGWRRGLAASTVAFNLGLLGLFKYADFFLLSVEDVARRLGSAATLPLLEVGLPVGVSFFTFEAISYAVDVYRRHARPVRLVDFGLYLSFFPHLVAGPLVRVDELVPQLTAATAPRSIEVGRALRLILGGLAKKVLLADTLAGVVDPAFANPAATAPEGLVLAVYAYAAQIWCDFSAYTDIAIGVSLLFGLSLPDNFRQPYAAQSMQDFWRRWHISLSRWLRDYLYLPLGGSQGGGLDTARNLAITMILGGLWHGADWRFALWGAVHGGALLLERGLGWNGPAQPGMRGFSRAVLVFHVVALAWIPFRAPSLAVAGEVLGGMVRAGWSWPNLGGGVGLALGIALFAQWTPQAWGPALDRWISQRGVVVQAGLVGFGLMIVDALGPDGVAAFIYYQF